MARRPLPTLVTCFALVATSFAFPAAAHPVDIVIEAESFATKTTGSILADGAASNGQAWSMTASGSISNAWFAEHAGAYRIRVVARGIPANGSYPMMSVFTDNRAVGHFQVSGAYADYVAPDWVPLVEHTLRIRFDNPFPGRALIVDLAEVILDAPNTPLPTWTEAESFSTKTTGAATVSGSASAGAGWNLWSNGQLRTGITVGSNVTTYNATIWARADLARGVGADMSLLADGVTVGGWRVSSPAMWTAYFATLTLPPGAHTLAIAFTNDYRDASGDRNLHVDALRLRPTDFTPGAGETTRFEAESFAALPGSGAVKTDTAASAGKYWGQWSNGQIAMNYAPATAGDVAFAIRARGAPAAGVWPAMALKVDGVVRTTWSVNSGSYALYSTTVPLSAGTHTLAIAFTNDYYAAPEDRNLLLDALDITPGSGGSTPPPSPSPPPPPPPPPPPAGGPSEWPQSTFDAASSRFNANESVVTTANLSRMALAWNFPTPRAVVGAPAVFGGRVYAGDWGGTAWSLNATNGALRWKRDLAHGSLAGGPAVADGRVFFSAADATIFALDAASGALLWTTNIDGQAGTFAYGSLLYHAGKLYMGTATNQESSNFTGTPTHRGTFSRLDAATGAIDWTYYTVPPGYTGGSMWTAAALDPESMLVYFGTGNALTAPAYKTTDAILALDARNGILKWSQQGQANDVWTARNPAGPDSDFAQWVHVWRDASGRKLVGGGDKAGLYMGLNATTGAIVYRSQAPVTGEAFFGPSAFAYGRNYGGVVLNGKILATDASTGAVLWSSTVGTYLFSGVTAAGGAIWTGTTQGALAALHPATGTQLWKTTIPGGAQVYVAPSIAEGTVFAPYAVTSYKTGTGGIVAYRPT